MRRAFIVAGLLLATTVHPSLGVTSEEPSLAEPATPDQGRGFDPASPLDERVTKTPPDVLKMFADAGMTEVKTHVLTSQEQRQLSAAFEALPPLHRRILQERLMSFSFLDDMPNTALTSSVGDEGPRPLSHITIRAGIFRENVSEWATKKERTCFDASGSPLSVSIDAGEFDSIVYVLLHEATHLVDAALRITPDFRSKELPSGEVTPTKFTKGVWSKLTLPTPPYRDPRMQGTIFNAGGQVLPIAEAETLYTALQRTPFASLYASHAWSDDLAEYVAIYHWTQVLKQPYRIIIRNNGRDVLSYEPMKSSLVRSRFDQMQVYYK